MRWAKFGLMPDEHWLDPAPASAIVLAADYRKERTMTTFQNKITLVTGAARGIGRATATALAEAGAHVLVHYGRSAQEAESLVSEIQANGGSANAISADLGTPNGAALLAGQVRSIVGDRLDVLVLNAGVSKAARIADYTVEDFDNLFATNVRVRFSWCSNWCQSLVRAQTSFLSLPLSLVRWWANPVWKILQSLLMPLPKEQLRLWSSTGPPFLGQVAYA